MGADRTRATDEQVRGHKPGCDCLDCVMPAEEFNAAIREVSDQDFSEERCAELKAGNSDADLLRPEDEEDLREREVID